MTAFVTVTGQVTHTPTRRGVTDTGEATFEFEVHSNRRGKDKLWMTCTLYGRQVGYYANALASGRHVIVQGIWSKRPYTTKTGDQGWRDVVSVKDIDLLGRDLDVDEPATTNGAVPAPGG